MPNICTIITKETHANQICFEVLALKEKRKIILAGVVIGVIAAALVWFGNPKNMGFCIACFIRDTAGAVGMHRRRSSSTSALKSSASCSARSSSRP